MISTLGASPPPNSIIVQPSASIFDISTVIAGALIVLACLFGRHILKKGLFIPLLLLGIGTVGVGIFPAFHTILHPISALTAFLSGGIAAVMSARTIRSQAALFSLILGGMSLFFLLLGTVSPQNIVSILGKGGTERMVAYPLIVWLIMFGGYLLNGSGSKK